MKPETALSTPTYPHLGLFGTHTRADRELVAKHIARISTSDAYTLSRLAEWIAGATYGVADADDILCAAADAVAEARKTK